VEEAAVLVPAAVLMVSLVVLVPMHISQLLESHLELFITSVSEVLHVGLIVQMELMVVGHM
jgi:hypothetical protein